MAYMSKKANMRQNSIVTLSDQNKKEIEDIRKQKEDMIKAFEDKKSILQHTLLEKQHLLIKYKKDLEDMSEYKVLNFQKFQLSNFLSSF
jgi:hypothetical protein